MKKIPLLILLVVMATFCRGQETVRKVKYSRNGDKEVFYVLKSKQNVLHGIYEKKGGSASVKGEYKNGLKDGVWTEFSKGIKIWTRGAYAENNRVGLWKFYDWQGELEQEYDFSTKQLVSDVQLAGMKQRKFKVIKGADTIFSFLERPPVYITGKTRMQSALTKGSTIGLLLRLTQVSGNVKIAFTIDTTGRARDYRILNGIHEVCDAEALRMVKQIPPNWFPALLEGKPVEVEHTINIALRNNF